MSQEAREARDRNKYGNLMNSGNGTRQDTLHPSPSPDLMGSETLVGKDVYNQSGESLGDIKEIMLDMGSGTIAYAVLSYGTFLGLGTKLFAVPWSALRLDREHRCFLLNVAKAQLKDAPGFDREHWPDMADKAWASNIHSFYGTTLMK
jgi:sporulation protein YlmC with PRC-barrel domain